MGIAAQAWGDAGDDTLTFERSADFVDGGEGFDTYFFNPDFPLRREMAALKSALATVKV